MSSSPDLGVKTQQYFVRWSGMFLDSKPCLRFGLILGLTGPAFEEPRFLSLRFKSIVSDNFFLFFRASNHQSVDKKIKPSLLFKLSYLNSNFALTLGYLNPSLNNTAQDSGFRIPQEKPSLDSWMICLHRASWLGPIRYGNITSFTIKYCRLLHIALIFCLLI